MVESGLDRWDLVGSWWPGLERREQARIAVLMAALKVLPLWR